MTKYTQKTIKQLYPIREIIQITALLALAVAVGVFVANFATSFSGI